MTTKHDYKTARYLFLVKFPEFQNNNDFLEYYFPQQLDWNNAAFQPGQVQSSNGCESNNQSLKYYWADTKVIEGYTHIPQLFSSISLGWTMIREVML